MIALALLLLAGLAAPVRAAERTAPSAAALEDTLSFEFQDGSGAPAGWTAVYQPARWDSVVTHGGHGAARFERDRASSGSFSALSRTIPADLAGDSLTLVGWLRTENVTEFAGLWIREDSGGGTMVQFDNMQDRGVRGTTAWAEYRVTLPLDRGAKRIVFGGLCAGTGTAWLDDVRLLVDDKPIATAPRVVRPRPRAEEDHEFDRGSRLSERDLRAAPVQNLVLAAKVWGFLKYHHPRIAGGDWNWDYELFRALPDVARARGRAGVGRSFARWIDRVGMPARCRPCAAPPDSAALEAPVAWIHDRRLLGDELVSRLERVYRDRPTSDEQYYVGFAPAQNPTFMNEDDHKAIEFPDAGFRLLALFRFWNMVEYWYPYRDLLRGSWDATLAEFVPRFLDCRNRDEYRLAAIDLVARLHDSHANVWNALDARPPLGGCRLPVALRPLGDQFVVGGYADSARSSAGGLRIGDVLRGLDGAPVDSLARAWSPHYGASNETSLRRNLAGTLTQGSCGPCRVAVERTDGVHEVPAVRDSSAGMDRRAGITHDLPGPVFRKLSDDVAYLKLSEVVAADAVSYVEKAAGTRCLVIDIRNYPSQFVVFALGEHLVDRATPFARFTHGDAANPGAFLWTPPVALEPAPPRYEGRIVILVDELSQSQAEYTTMAFRSVPGALVVGSTTSGADGNVSPIPLPGGLKAMITGLGVFYPDGKPTQQIGIVPDLVVHPTLAGIREGRDEVLEAALEAALGREVHVPAQP